MLNAGECLVLETHSHPGPGSCFSSPWQLRWLADKPGSDERSPGEREGDGQSRWRRTEVMTQPPRGHMSFSDWPIACLTFDLRFTLSLSTQNHSIRMTRNQHSRVDTLFFFPRRDVAWQPVLQKYNKHRHWMTTWLMSGQERERPIGTAELTSDTPPHGDWQLFGNINNIVYYHNLSNVICNVFIWKYNIKLSTKVYDG